MMRFDDQSRPNASSLACCARYSLTHTDASFIDQHVVAHFAAETATATPSETMVALNRTEEPLLSVVGDDCLAAYGGQDYMREVHQETDTDDRSQNDTPDGRVQPGTRRQQLRVPLAQYTHLELTLAAPRLLVQFVRINYHN
jgi:hypothetical protein